MIISIASGKGGTGKTTVATNLAVSIGSDLHLLTDPEIKERHDFQGGSIAVINPDKCTECGLCRDLCRFDAVSEAFKVDPIECEGCGVCVDFCPEGAIDFPVQTCGEWFISDTRFGRAAYILIVDTETLDFEVMDNKENVNALKGAGIQTASMVSEKGAKVLLTGFCGPKAFMVLDAAKIKVANEAKGTVREAVKAFEDGKLSFADEANVEGHW